MEPDGKNAVCEIGREGADGHSEGESAARETLAQLLSHGFEAGDQIK